MSNDVDWEKFAVLDFAPCQGKRTVMFAAVEPDKFPARLFRARQLHDAS